MRDLAALVNGKTYIFKLEEKQHKKALYSCFEVLVIKNNSKIPLKRFICDTLTYQSDSAKYTFSTHTISMLRANIDSRLVMLKFKSVNTY